MTGEAETTALLSALAASEPLARHGYTVFATPAGAIVVQKDGIFHGLWRSTDAGLKWTAASGGEPSVTLAGADDAVAHTLATLGIPAG